MPGLLLRIGVVCLAGLILAAASYAQSSENYSILKSAFSQGGGISESGAYWMMDVVGQPLEAGEMMSESYVATAGFIVGDVLPTHADHGRGAFEPENFLLLQNFPNPFNPETTIAYQLAELADVKISIYDVHGQHIRIWIRDSQNSGKHSIVWDGRNLGGEPVASGMYFYRIEAVPKNALRSFVDVKKMVLVK